MEERQDTHDAIVGVQHENLVELLHVRSNVVMREHDAFGVTGRAAGKNNRGQVVQRCGAMATCKSRHGPGGQEPGSQCGGQALTEAGVLGDVLDENRFAGRLDLDLFEKDPCGDDRFQAALLCRGGQSIIRNGVGQVYRHLAHQHRGVIHQRARNRWRQQDTHHFLPVPLLFEAPREHQSPGQRRKPTQFGPLPVGHGEAPGMPPRRVDE